MPCVPSVVLVNHGVHWIMERWYSFPVTDQVAVEQIRLSYGRPFLYAITSLAIITLVPLIEELLFRGYLQQWLKKYISPFYSIVLTALIFALFHYSSEQG